MKKWFIAICLVFVLLLAGVYFFIPGTTVVTRSIIANANQNGVYRSLTDGTNWARWWPGSTSVNNSTDTVFESGEYTFRKTTQGFNVFGIVIEKGTTIDSSFLHLFGLGNDSVKIEWQANLSTASNPLARIRNYFKTRELGKKIESVLSAMENYMSNTKNLYGLDIKQEKMQIDFMVSIKKTFAHYPTTEDIYAEMDQIRKYMVQAQATETSYPVLNISSRDSAHFDLVVAIPVDKLVPDFRVFTQRRMLKNGNFLSAEITGGKYAVDAAFKQMESYARDHHHLNIAIPFQSFLTDRMKVRDTSKWVTRIGYPIL